jgi:4-hydroxy-tetrahydrodipicolinate reductase
MRLAVVGASGRMGEAVLRVVAGYPDIEVVCRVSEGDDVATLAASGAEVAIDFSSPIATCRLAEIAPAAKCAIVTGTTGLDAYAATALDEASQSVAVFAAANMSIGVEVLRTLVAAASAMLGPEFDVEIVEAHHRKKVDAPSGTALAIAESVRAVHRHHALVHGREGRPGARPAAEIGMHAIRGGDVIGDHTAFFFGDGERIELTHRASNRDLFARGAVRAARWVARMPPGRYGMSDLVKMPFSDRARPM